ncbi:hypothetical protein SASPL_142339 [Salvia splendens]|uniref:Uncharacterized protein n=1 Tax=Salvia splendens TaxID=180675 RepID=A0A8X8WLQ1_SALSN|nr:hypothetical protein SASPL_142339 [Salvia splendens]
MAFMVAENEASFSDESQKKEVRMDSVSSHLLLKPSRLSLVQRVKNAISAAVVAANESDDKWLQRGDAFTFP